VFDSSGGSYIAAVNGPVSALSSPSFKRGMTHFYEAAIQLISWRKITQKLQVIIAAAPSSAVAQNRIATVINNRESWQTLFYLKFSEPKIAIRILRLSKKTVSGCCIAFSTLPE
jgi:hypothetical protein